jgi:hypothetical protein
MVMSALGNIGFEISMMIAFGVVCRLGFNGLQVIQVQACLYVQAIPTFLTNAGVIFGLFIGVDRLINAALPIW